MTGSGPGPLVGRLPAQRQARHELAVLARVPLWERLVRDIVNWLGRGRNALGTGWLGSIILAILVVTLIVVVVAWASPRRERRVRRGAVLGGPARTAAGYRAEAERLAAAGDYDQAVIEGVRAIAAELEERQILLPRPGRTANEVGTEAGAELPSLAGDLRAVTGLFDDVRYGGRPGSPAAYELVRQADAQVRA